MNKRLWILGTSDPEMAAVERLLRELGEAVVYATIDHKRCHAGNAYSKDIQSVNGEGYRHQDIYSVECAGHYYQYGDSFTVNFENRIDHHRPGDPGYGKPPAEYWQASSLGQVIAVLATFPEFCVCSTPVDGEDYDGYVRVDYGDRTDGETVALYDAHYLPSRRLSQRLRTAHMWVSRKRFIQKEEPPC